jgi:transcriptional antiterminator NusG
MMAVDRKQLEDAAFVGPTDRQTARLEAARAFSRRAQALLAAAGEAVPDRRWYVLRIRPKHEIPVENALHEAGVERWLPRVKLVPRPRPGRRGKAPEPKMVLAWPGYMFVKVANVPACWAGLATVDGIISVLGTAERPIPVPEEKLLRYKLFLERDEGARKVLLNEIEVGQTVRIEGGPFASVIGQVVEQRDQRVKVEAWLFGRATVVELDLAQVARAR